MCEAGAGGQAEGCVPWRECQGAARRKSRREDPGGSARRWGGAGRTCSDLILSTAPGTPPNPALLQALCWLMLGILW